MPPIPSPEKIICIGLNYADHARESGAAPPSEPVLFSKFPTAVAAHEAADRAARGSAARWITRPSWWWSSAAAAGTFPWRRPPSHIAAYCCGNDVSARDWQLHKPGGQWLLGKSFDTFAPCGPWLVTADEVPDPGNLRIQLRLNGRVMQDSSTAQFIFSVEELVGYVSEVCTLSPGDLIFTGTPPGVGFARKPPVFLQPGDVVEVEIERLGVLRNPVVAEECKGLGLGWRSSAWFKSIGQNIMEPGGKPSDPYWKLRPVGPTPADEICRCADLKGVVLRDSLGENPIHCLVCNGEVPPERA